MGFGTVFVGYVLLLNISYFTLTDIIAALVMLMGFIRLSRFNREFSACCALAGLFSALSLLEFIEEICVMFDARANFLSGIGSALSMTRYALIGILTSVMLLGIVRIAKEVDHAPLAKRAERLIPFVGVTYILLLLADSPLITLIPTVSAYIMFALILIQLVVAIITLATVYKAYMGICMPGDENPETKKSRFGFVNEMREREDELRREFTENQTKKLEERIQKNKKRRKK